MGSFKVSDKELLEVRNKIFLESGVPSLKKNGFSKSPFSTSWFGKDNLGDFTYELCRLTNEGFLEIVLTHITKGDRWIKIFLNIFQLHPEINAIEQLEGRDGMEFHLPPNSLTKMRLRNEDYKGPPLFYMLFLPEHKIGRYSNKSGFDKEVSNLGMLIKEDMANIDSFVKRWHELHKPNVVDWGGNKI